jgi:Mrp family chromosome partitioning ATPase
MRKNEMRLLHQLDQGEESPSPLTSSLAVLDVEEVSIASGCRMAKEEAIELVERLLFSDSGKAPRAIVFAGVEHGTGCSEVATSFAAALVAHSRGPVCLVEANFRSPVFSERFGMTTGRGLADALAEDGPIRSFASPAGNRKLWVLASGENPADSIGLLASMRFQERLEELRADFDFVIIDAPPLHPYSDVLPIARGADGLVLVLQAGLTRRETARAAAASMRNANIPLLGAVLNRRSYPIPDAFYRML